MLVGLISGQPSAAGQSERQTIDRPLMTIEKAPLESNELQPSNGQLPEHVPFTRNYDSDTEICIMCVVIELVIL